jgi:hypothetical protein
LKGIEFPVKLSDVSKFTKRTDMSINVYCFDNKSIALEITKTEKHIDLLFYKNQYCWVQSLEKLLWSQVTKHKEKIFLCRMCLNSFYSEEKLSDHKTYCGEHKTAKIIMPEPYDNIIQLKNYNHSLKVPFAIYSDFESMLQKIDTCQPSDETSYTNAHQEHIPINFAYHIKYSNDDFQPPREYSGLDADEVFYKNLKEDALHIAREFYDKVVPINPSEAEMLKFKTEKICHICERSFDVLPPILVNKIVCAKKAIQYYKYLNDEQSVD